MNKKRSMAAACLCLVLLLAACARDEGTAQPGDYSGNWDESGSEVPEEKEYQAKLDLVEPSAYRSMSGLTLESGSYISVIGQSKGGGFWEQVKAGAEQAADDLNDELNYEGSDAVRVVYSGPETSHDVDEQVNLLDEELARYPVAVAISVIDAKACGVQFDLAAESGIPVVAYDSASEYQGLMATVSTDNKAAGAEAADKMAELLPEGGKVVVFVHDSRTRSCEDRESGFTERLAEQYPNITVAGVFHMNETEEIKAQIAGGGSSGGAGGDMPAGVSEDAAEDTAEDTSEALTEDITEEEIMDYILEKDPDVKGYFAADGDATEALDAALTRAERQDVAVIGYDIGKETLDSLENGEIDGLVVQNPFGMGYAAVAASVRAASGMGNEAYIDTGYMMVTKENLYSDAVQALMY